MSLDDIYARQQKIYALNRDRDLLRAYKSDAEQRQSANPDPNLIHGRELGVTSPQKFFNTIENLDNRIATLDEQISTTSQKIGVLESEIFAKRVTMRNELLAQQNLPPLNISSSPSV